MCNQNACVKVKQCMMMMMVDNKSTQRVGSTITISNCLVWTARGGVFLYNHAYAVRVLLEIAWMGDVKKGERRRSESGNMEALREIERNIETYRGELGTMTKGGVGGGHKKGAGGGGDSSRHGYGKTKKRMNCN